jgi:general secretion pathway protein L
VRLIPTIALASILMLLSGALAAHSSYADSRYLGVLQHEVLRFEPQARRIDALERQTAAMRARAQAIDDFRRRTKSDMDTIAEITKVIAPPGFVSSMDLDRNTIQLAGEMDQAAVVLKQLDESPFFERSQFTMPITRGVTGEVFRVRAERQTPPPAPAKPVAHPATPAGGGSR